MDHATPFFSKRFGDLYIKVLRNYVQEPEVFGVCQQFFFLGAKIGENMSTLTFILSPAEHTILRIRCSKERKDCNRNNV